MIFRPLHLPGAWIVEPELRPDHRGFFARAFCRNEFAAQGLDGDYVQTNLSHSIRRGTLRGLHFQLPPSAETKLVRCIRGELFDVIVNMRPDSPTFRQWHGEVLTPENRLMMVVPRGFAHGFITLADDTEALYMVSAFYDSAAERGLRWDDPALAISWPLAPVVLSDRDRAHPLLEAAATADKAVQ